MITPIIIMVRNPKLELLSLLSNLEQTNLHSNPIIIVDDFSTEENSKKLLYSNKDVEFKERKILGIKGKYNIIQTPKKLGKIYRVLFSLNAAVKLFPNSETCALIEDITEFDKNWLNKLNYMYIKRRHIFNISMLSTINSNYNEKINDEFLMNEPIEGKITMFTRKFYKELKRIGYFSIAELKGIGTSYSLLQRISKNIGFNTIKFNVK